MVVYKEIGERLRLFGQAKFSSMTDFANALGVKPQTLNSYLSGKVRPGNSLEARLKKMGCDIIWLEYGKNEQEINQEFQSMVNRLKKQELTKGEMEIIAILRVLEITEPIDFHIYFDYARAVQDKIKKGTGKPHQYKMVAESQAKYNITKKRTE